MRTFLITGGCGFIGSNYVRLLFQDQAVERIINLDKLTYAGNPTNLKSVQDDPRYTFVKGDICDRQLVRELFQKYRPDVLVNFAAESHVDRSIGKPDDFIRTDVYGAFSLLENAREFGLERFIQISTDEVYGSILDGRFKETDPLMPSNPYSASKAGADRLAYSYFVTYGLPVIVTRASNNFGPYQYPEKLIPLFVTNAMEDKPLPLYGDGKNVRDWLFVEDHCAALQFIIDQGILGETYNIGGGNERMNVEITHLILEHLGKSPELIQPVTDRLGHDRRYALDCTKLQQLGWSPETPFEDALRQTIDWYVAHPGWWQQLKGGEYLEYYKRQYET